MIWLVPARRGRRAARRCSSSASSYWRVGDDDDRVAAVHEARGGAVDLHLARAALAGDRVGLEAGAVVDVDDVHLLVLEDVGGLEQVGVDRDRADVVQVAVGDRRAVDLGLQHRALHGCQWSLPSAADAAALSIRRTSPTRAATATSSVAVDARRPARASRGRRARGTRARRRRRASSRARRRARRAGVALAGAAARLARPRRARAQSASARSRSAGVEAGVAAGQRQAVGLADGRAGPRSRTGHVEVAHEPADDERPAGRPSGRSTRRRARPC